MNSPPFPARPSGRFSAARLASRTRARSGGFDPVTAADRAAETAMRALIKRTFPEHGVVGEEFASRPAGRRICLGARPDRRHQILHLRHAGLGHADRADAARRADLRHDAPAVHPRAFFRRRPRRALSRAGRRPRLADARLAPRSTTPSCCTTSPLLMNEADRQCFGRVEKTVRLSRYGGDCYAYCVLAAGHVDLVIETELKPYDVLALIPIIEGAGGIMTTWENGRAAQRRPHRRRRRQARARAGDGIAERLNSTLRTPRSNPALNRALDSFVAIAPGNDSRSIQRRARHEGVERRPELRADSGPAPSAISCWAPTMTRCEPARSSVANSSIAAFDTTTSLPPATISIGWRMCAGIAALAHRRPWRGTRHRPRPPSAAERQRRLGLENRGIAGVAHRIRGQDIADEGPRLDRRWCRRSGTYMEPKPASRMHAHDQRPRSPSYVDAAERDQRRGQHHAVEPAVAAMGGADQNGGAGGMAERENRRRAIRQHDFAHEGFEIGVVFGEIAHIALAAVAQRAVGQALAAPIERRDRKAARAQIAHGLEIFFDPFAAALEDAHRAAAAGRRLPARKAQVTRRPAS